MRTQFEPPRRAGLTILEMLVSTAMLSFIVLGLTAMLIQTQKAFRTGIKQNTITDAGRTIIDMISGDLLQMSDGQNTNPIENNFFWAVSNTPPVYNYLNGLPVRTNELSFMYVLEHTNATWTGVGYAVSNYTGPTGGGIGIGALYRYETNWTSPAPFFTNDLFSAFYYSVFTQTFFTNYWHRIADGVIDLRILAYDQYGNVYYPPYINRANQYAYPFNPFLFIPRDNTNVCNTNLPNAVELEFGILEPDALTQARVLAGSPLALSNFLSSNALPKMEIFRQRITIAAASR